MRMVVGVAATAGFACVRIEKGGLYDQPGAGRRILEIFESHGCYWRAMPTALGSVDVIIPSQAWRNAYAKVLDDLRATVVPDAVHVLDGLALVAVVGHTIAYSAAHAAQICRVLDGAHVHRHAMLAGATPDSIILAVEEERCHASVSALHAALIEARTDSR
jgi:aspartokinase